MLHSLEKHFKLTMFSPELWKREMRRQPRGGGGGWEWGHLQKYKYLRLHFPTSFPALRLTIYCVKLTRKEQGAVLSRRPRGKELSVPTPAQAGRDWGEGAISQTNLFPTKWLPQLTWSKHPVSPLRIQAKEEVHMEHEMPTPRASGHLLSWKLSIKSHCQDDLGNPGSLWPTAFNILGTSTSFPRAK